jgi:thioesterase domain-containing protein
MPDRSIEAAARRNLDAIRSVQPNGPYALGGHSFGGMVAFEMACRLRAAGEAVDVLIVLDSDAPLGRRRLARRIRGRREVITADAPRRGVPYGIVVAARAMRALAGSAYAHAERRATAASVGWVTRRGVAQYDAFYRLHGVMARKYRPSTNFDGRVVVLRASGSGDLGWSQLTTGPVTVVRVPGDHNSLLRSPAVEEVGRQVSDVLRGR